ncbi:MAG: hypothetical protein QOI80_2597 [Solirubrobacteraceae bacterium]|nr:hypothetical protein [Solirubrobacteraceae bacterium]
MRPLPAPLPVDLAIALLLGGWWLADVGDSTGAGVASLVLMTVPLGWRRTAPLATMVLVAGGFAASGLETSPPEPLPQLAAALVASYSVAVHARTWGMALAGLGAGLAGGVGEALLLGGEDVGFILILTVAAWGAGGVVRRLTGRSVELEARVEMLDARARLAAAEERERIARELHDIVSHSVGIMVVQAGAAEQVLRTDPERAQRALRSVQAAGRGAVDDLRRMLGLLRGGGQAEGSRSPQPGLAELDGLVADHGAMVRLERGELGQLPAGVDLAAYRIVQEALTNAGKHAPGQPTSVRIASSGGWLELEVRTEAPPRNGAHGTGHGLVGMRERVALYGGTFDAGIDDRADWVVHASLPTGDP